MPPRVGHDTETSYQLAITILGLRTHWNSQVFQI